MPVNYSHSGQLEPLTWFRDILISSNFHYRDLQGIVSYLPVNGSLCGQLQPLTYLIPEYSNLGCVQTGHLHYSDS